MPSRRTRDFTNWYGPSDHDVRHRLTANFVVNLPLGDTITRDWSRRCVYTAQKVIPA